MQIVINTHGIEALLLPDTKLDFVASLKPMEKIGYGDNAHWVCSPTALQFSIIQDDSIGPIPSEVARLITERDDYRRRWLDVVAQRDDLKSKLAPAPSDSNAVSS